MASERLDDGNAQFDPSTLAVTGFDVGNPANNVIPARAVARFNIRYNNEHDAESLGRWVRADCDRVSAESGGSFAIEPSRARPASSPNRGRWSTWSHRPLPPRPASRRNLHLGWHLGCPFHQGFLPGGGVRPVNQTIHQANENIAADDLRALTRIYGAVLERYFAKRAA